MSNTKLATLLFTGLVAVASCGESDTIIEVQVVGNNISGIVQLEVDVSIGTDRRNFKVPGEAQSIALPTSFSIQVAPDLQGPVGIAIKALAENGDVIAQKSVDNALAKLTKGSVNRIVVALTGGLSGADGGITMTPRDDGGMLIMTGDAGRADGAVTGGKDGGVVTMDAGVVTPDAAVVLPDADLPMPDAEVSVDAPEIESSNGM